MALGDPYATLTQLKLRFGINDAIDDAAATSALAAASQGIEGYCGRQFNDAGSASARIYYPVLTDLVMVHDFSTTVGLVVAVDSGADGSYATTLTSGQYQLEPLNGIVDGATWPYHQIRAVNTAFPDNQIAPLKVTARWGWATVPAPVVESCLILAEEIFKLKSAPYGVANFDQFGAVRVRDNPKVAKMLGRYMQYGV